MSRPAPKSNIDSVIRGEAEHRFGLEQKLKQLAGDVLSEIKASDARLKDLATQAGRSFKETFEKGSVSVSPRKDREFVGNVPEAEPLAFIALTAAEKRDLEKRGIIKIVPSWKAASYGRVAVDTF